MNNKTFKYYYFKIIKDFMVLLGVLFAVDHMITDPDSMGMLSIFVFAGIAAYFLSRENSVNNVTKEKRNGSN